MSLPSSLFHRLRLPLIAAPMLRVSGPDLVIAACRNGVIAAFPTANCQDIGELDHWLTLIETALAQGDALDVRRATLSDLVNGKAALSPEMALRIEKAFGVRMETLLNMQTWHDAHAMRRRAGEINVKPYQPPASASR